MWSVNSSWRFPWVELCVWSYTLNHAPVWVCVCVCGCRWSPWRKPVDTLRPLVLFSFYSHCQSASATSPADESKNTPWCLMPALSVLKPTIRPSVRLCNVSYENISVSLTKEKEEYIFHKETVYFKRPLRFVLHSHIMFTTFKHIYPSFIIGAMRYCSQW